MVPGRTFLQRAINLTRGVPSRFHHIRLNKEFFKDLDMWKVFLANWNGRSLSLESSPTPTADLELYTDAAGSIGFGGYWQGKRFQGHWPPHMRLNREQGISIEWQELFPIVVACSIWHPFLSGKRLQFWCDNQSVVSIINSGHSKVPRIMDWLESSFSFPCNITFWCELAMSLGSQMSQLMHSPAFRCSASGPSPPTPTRVPVSSRLH